MDLKRVALAIRHCGKIRALKLGESYHSHLIKHGLCQDVFLVNNVISMYLDFELLENGQKLFDEMSERNVVTWTTVASAYTRYGRPDEAIGLYRRMLDFELAAPNGFMYSAILKACSIVGDIKLGRRVSERIYRENLVDDVVLMNTLLDMYVKCGTLNEAKKTFFSILCPSSVSWNTVILGCCRAGLMDEAVGFFSQMPQPNGVSWNTLIAGFADNGSPRALEFSCKMHREGCRLDEFTLPCALKACGFIGSPNIGKQFHCYIVKWGFGSSCFVISSLVDMYSNCRLLNDAVNLFCQCSGQDLSACKTLALWNSMLSGYVVNHENKAALDLLLRIYNSGLPIDSYTLSAALKLCVNFLDLRLGLQVHGLVVISGYELDYIVGSVLIDFYATLGSIDDALALFQRLPKKDAVAWSGLIMSCSKTGCKSLAFSLFEDMLALGLHVDQFVISSVLKVCSGLASLANGKQVHGHCVKRGYEYEVVTVTALIDMYSKCGEIDDALALFNFAQERDVMCWTGIIVGSGQNGRVNEAIQYLQEMIRLGLKPNEVTFLGVLSACRHAGLVEEAGAIFKSMKEEQELEPHLEHYYCMVDLLGQAGRFKEAEELIHDMPFKPDKTIWSSLISACGAHKNTKLVGAIAEQLLETFPTDPSVYVMVSNAYAAVEMWDQLREVREAARRLGSKYAGKSWIEFT